ncbi:energy-coupling factor transport system ATP-binding protein [Providencia alcalifaciens]|nr:energy-coupling factor transport system ATP-binding protein [Providencia alcalifaciens]
MNFQKMGFTPKGMESASLGPVDIQLAAGEWLTVLGGNGSGKSTLAQLLCGWLPELLIGQLDGTAEVFSQPISEGSLATLSAHRQLVQQSPQLQLSGCTFSVEHEVAFGPENLGLSEEEIRQRVNESIALTNCEKLRHRHPVTLSGGEAQRVVLASALAMRPNLLLLDEAFSRLTPKATHTLLVQLKQYSLQTGCSVILFERSLLPAISFCDQLMLLEAGKIIASGDRATVFSSTQSTINMPDAWRALGHLVSQNNWKAAIPSDDDALLQAFKDNHATPR